MTPPNDNDRTDLWRISFPDTIVRRSWGSDVVVHDGSTHNVHLLDAFSAAILEQLMAGSSDIALLAMSLRMRFGLDSGDLPARVEAVCVKLERLDLIERIRP